VTCEVGAATPSCITPFVSVEPEAALNGAVGFFNRNYPQAQGDLISTIANGRDSVNTLATTNYGKNHIGSGRVNYQSRMTNMSNMSRLSIGTSATALKELNRPPSQSMLTGALTPSPEPGTEDELGEGKPETSVVTVENANTRGCMASCFGGSGSGRVGDKIKVRKDSILLQSGEASTTEPFPSYLGLEGEGSPIGGGTAGTTPLQTFVPPPRASPPPLRIATKNDDWWIKRMRSQSSIAPSQHPDPAELDPLLTEAPPIESPSKASEFAPTIPRSLSDGSPIHSTTPELESTPVVVPDPGVEEEATPVVTGIPISCPPPEDQEDDNSSPLSGSLASMTPPSDKGVDEEPKIEAAVDPPKQDQEPLEEEPERPSDTAALEILRGVNGAEPLEPTQSLTEELLEETPRRQVIQIEAPPGSLSMEEVIQPIAPEEVVRTPPRPSPGNSPTTPNKVLSGPSDSPGAVSIAQSHRSQYSHAVLEAEWDYMGNLSSASNQSLSNSRSESQSLTGSVDVEQPAIDLPETAPRVSTVTARASQISQHGTASPGRSRRGSMMNPRASIVRSDVAETHNSFQSTPDRRASILASSKKHESARMTGSRRGSPNPRSLSRRSSVAGSEISEKSEGSWGNVGCGRMSVASSAWGSDAGFRRKSEWPEAADFGA